MPVSADPGSKPIRMILLMAPPGSGKSTLGNELNRQGVASYTELEPKLMELFGEGEEFAKNRPTAHLWIWDFYRRALKETRLPVVMETTGIAGRDFIEEMRARYRLLFVKLDTPKAICLERVRTRPRGRHVNDADEAFFENFYTHWHTNVAPTYDFGLTVSGTDLSSDVSLIRETIDRGVQ
jgi:predicted kinase